MTVHSRIDLASTPVIYARRVGTGRIVMTSVKGVALRRIAALGTTVAGAAALVLGGGGAMSSGTGSAAAIVHAPRLAIGRRVPRARTRATWSSSNWSGYAESGAFTAISGSWTVPSVTAGAASSGAGRFGFRRGSTSAWYSATWLGVDGFSNSNLIQTGTEQDYYGGAAHYTAWWEILPAAETAISASAYPVLPGDTMTASIVETPTQVTVGGGRRGGGTVEHEWTITLQDTTRQWSFITTQPYGGSGSSAEWIVEAPAVGGQIAPLADYSFPAGAAGAGDFASADVATTIGGAPIGAGLNYAADAGAMVQNNVQVSTPGSQDPAATAFNALYGPSAPSAPTS
jgi:hypothetical protein